MKINLVKVMIDHHLIMAMGKEGLEVNWSKIKIWTLGNKAKRVCNSSKRIQIQKFKRKPNANKKSKNQGVTRLLYHGCGKAVSPKQRIKIVVFHKPN